MIHATILILKKIYRNLSIKRSIISNNKVEEIEGVIAGKHAIILVIKIEIKIIFYWDDYCKLYNDLHVLFRKSIGVLEKQTKGISGYGTGI